MAGVARPDRQAGPDRRGAGVLTMRRIMVLAATLLLGAGGAAGAKPGKAGTARPVDKCKTFWKYLMASSARLCRFRAIPRLL